MGENDDYDPYAERNIKNGTTNGESLFHVLKGIIGTGVLALPKGYFYGGWVLSLPFTLVVSLLYFYVLDLTLFLKYNMSKRTKDPDITISNAFQLSIADGPPICKCLEKAGALLIDLSVLLFQSGVCCVYMIFVSQNLGKVAGLDWTVRTLLSCTLPAFLVIMMIPDLKKLAPVSFIADIAILIGLVIVLYYIFSGPLSFDDVQTFGDVGDFPLFWATVYFSFGSFGISMSVERNSLYPHKIRGCCGVLFQAILISAAIYIIVGFFGYLRYGSKIESVITLNLPSDAILGTVVLSLYVIAIFLSYPVNGYVGLEIMWKDYLKPKIQNERRHLLYEYILRIIFIFITFLFSLVIPFLGLFISLISSLVLSFQLLMLPAMFDIFVRYPAMGYGPGKWIIVKDALLFILGILSFVLGTLATVRDIIAEYKK